MHKNDNSTYERIKRSLGAENMPSESFIEVLRTDLDEVLKSYFAYEEGALSVSVVPSECGLELKVSCLARSRKPIKVL